MSKKAKRIKGLQMIAKLCPNFKPAKKIKDIVNNTKHKPKGQRCELL